MRRILICTVGTSLLNNLKRADEASQALVASQNWKQLSLHLLEQQNTDRLCGAEINSITRICEQGMLAERGRLIFLVSDTEDGKHTGQVLKQYYDHSRNPLSFGEVEVIDLVGLNDDSASFQKVGLKNLVRAISTEVRKFSAAAIAINATGGYKAQISFAGMIGQALEIPVYYLFERFAEIIELPPQPISLDLAFWLNHYVVFEQLEQKQTLLKSEVDLDMASEYALSLLDEEVIDGESVISLSAMGILFHERSRLQFARQERAILALIPVDETEPAKKKVHLSDDHHGKDVLKAFSKKLCRSPYVQKIINSMHYNSHQRHPIRRTDAQGQVEFVLTWTDPGFGLVIQTTGRNLAETNTIALHLVQQFQS